MGADIYVDSVKFTPPQKESWMSEGDCLGKNPEDFFSDSQGKTDDAKKICIDCPVRMECLAYIMAVEKGTSRRYGVFGGMGATQRKELQDMLDKLERKNNGPREPKGSDSTYR